MFFYFLKELHYYWNSAMEIIFLCDSCLNLKENIFSQDHTHPKNRTFLRPKAQSIAYSQLVRICIGPKSNFIEVEQRVFELFNKGTKTLVKIRNKHCSETKIQTPWNAFHSTTVTMMWIMKQGRNVPALISGHLNAYPDILRDEVHVEYLMNRVITRMWQLLFP